MIYGIFNYNYTILIIIFVIIYNKINNNKFINLYKIKYNFIIIIKN
jgi:hypothetical protein